MADTLDIFLVAPPGLEPVLGAEATERGFSAPRPVPGGVSLRGDWEDVRRANRELRGATRVLVRIAEFRALHLAQLDKRARKVPWGDTLRQDVPVQVEATCRASRIYHAGAAASRIARAIAEELGAPVIEGRDPDAVVVKARIEDDLCTVSVDTTGAALHRRGHKQAVGKAPLRETLAALFLRAAGYAGREPVLDPMCGSGTFVIEAAEIALGLVPGRARGFAYERLAATADLPPAHPDMQPAPCDLRFLGFDRDAGAVAAARANAERAGLGEVASFARQSLSALERPPGPPGLIAVNPPYGTRIGDRKTLHALYDTLGRRLSERFAGWRVALVATDAGLVRSTGLPFAQPGPPVPHGGLKLRLHVTDPLP